MPAFSFLPIFTIFAPLPVLPFYHFYLISRYTYIAGCTISYQKNPFYFYGGFYRFAALGIPIGLDYPLAVWHNGLDYASLDQLDSDNRRIAI